jgi:hypothetical protein
MNATKQPIRVPVHHQINVNQLGKSKLPFEELKPVQYEFKVVSEEWEKRMKLPSS